VRLQLGTEGTRVCNYGQACGVLQARGKDAAAIKIGEGLVRPYICGRMWPATARVVCAGRLSPDQRGAAQGFGDAVFRSITKNQGTGPRVINGVETS
jgi:hypothetical protein